MTNVVNNGARVPVVFSFFTGTGGLSRREGAAEGTVAIRENLRGTSPGPGLVDGQPVQAVKIQKSPTVPGMTLVDVVFDAPAQEQE